jgi:MFS family permease
MRGRVMALYFMCFLGGTPIGAPVIGWVANRFGAPWGLILGGGVCVVAGVTIGVVLARRRATSAAPGVASEPDQPVQESSWPHLSRPSG